MVCIFCDIAQGKTKSWKIYEDDQILIFLDAFPVNEGHCIVASKQHYKTMHEIPSDLAAYMFNTARKMGGVLVKALRADAVNIATAPSAISHFHLHVIPRYSYDLMGPLADLDNKRDLPPEEMERVAEQIRSVLFMKSATTKTSSVAAEPGDTAKSAPESGAAPAEAKSEGTGQQ